MTNTLLPLFQGLDRWRNKLPVCGESVTLLLTTVPRWSPQTPFILTVAFGNI